MTLVNLNSIQFYQFPIKADLADKQSGAWLAQAVGHDKTLLKSLKKNSSALYEIARDFETSYHDADMVCFYENKEASYGPWRTQVCQLQLYI
jgi:hypothetical protein